MCRLLDVTVITVCYNCENEIEKTIESVYLQKGNNYEYIIQDGKSSDDTLAKAERYREKFADKDISFTIYSQEDNGIYHAMNLAAIKSTARYLLFLNAGDVLCHENVFNTLDAAYLQSDADVFYGDALMVDQSGTRLFQADMRLISCRMPFAHQACFISRVKFLSHMYNLAYTICSDYDLILKLYEEQCVFKYLSTIVCKYDMGGISSCSYVEKRREHEDILREHCLSSPNYKYMAHMAEAYIKGILDHILPNHIKNGFRRLYMEKVKHYKYWGGEIY